MAQSKMYDHALRVYNRMIEQADATEDGDIIYRGFLSNLFQQELKLPLPYYSIIKRALEELGCIEQQKRGGGTSPSEWRLYFSPDPLLFEQLMVLDSGRRRQLPRNRLEQTIASMNSRLSEVERQVAVLLKESENGNSHLGRG